MVERNKYSVRITGDKGTLFGTLYATKEQIKDLMDVFFVTNYSAVCEMEDDDHETY